MLRLRRLLDVADVYAAPVVFLAQGGVVDLDVKAYIILLTSRDEDLDVIRGLEAGADDYIRKPFDQSLLRARVRVGERLVAMQRQHLQRETARYVEQLETAVSELRRSRRRIVEAQEQARRAIADELHGTVQTQVYARWLKLTALGLSMVYDYVSS